MSVVRSTMSVVVAAVFHPVADRHNELIEALRDAIPAVHQEDGCQLCAIHDADDGTITMTEKWDSREALAAHNMGPRSRHSMWRWRTSSHSPPR
jgi:quinol monooxygenase YgiN